MKEPQHIKIDDYNYPLPDERIAKYPLSCRDKSKLLIYRNEVIDETVFNMLPTLITSGELMVFNNTKVIQARLHFRKETGALIEVFILEPQTPADYAQNFAQRRSCSWLCLIGNLKKWKEGALERILKIPISGESIPRNVTLTATRLQNKGTSHEVLFEWDDNSLSFAELLEVVGELPIPPYLNRETEESDKQTYQTVYSKIEGSVAAPTAGLHFTPSVLEELTNSGVEKAEVTLHVGAGTFKPVKSEEIAGHEMHTEWISLHYHTLLQLIAHGGQAIAVGTTSVRTLESLYYMGCTLFKNSEASEEEFRVTQWQPYQTSSSEPTTLEALEALRNYMEVQELDCLHTNTQILIAPGYKFHVVKAMITNFHQPKSTLLLLVSAFVGEANWRTIYDYALAHDFRFLSYGDSSILFPKNNGNER